MKYEKMTLKLENISVQRLSICNIECHLTIFLQIKNITRKIVDQRADNTEQIEGRIEGPTISYSYEVCKETRE